MDFVTAWKASSIVLTGTFGILGLVKEYKDKATNRITVWGHISLAGVLLSSALGVMAQLKESSDDERTKTETAKQTLALAQNTDKAVRGIQRILSPLDDPQITLTFDLSCQDKELKRFCQVITERGNADRAEHRGFELNSWPGANATVLPLNLNFFADKTDALLFISGKKTKGDLFIDIYSTNYGKERTLVAYPNPSGSGVSLAVLSYRPTEFESDGRIRSILDLPGVTVMITEFNGELARLKLKTFEMRLKNGQSVTANGPFEEIVVEGQAAYRYVFPVQD